MGTDFLYSLRDRQLLDLGKTGKRTFPDHCVIGGQLDLFTGCTDNAFCIVSCKYSFTHSFLAPLSESKLPLLKN